MAPTPPSSKSPRRRRGARPRKRPGLAGWKGRPTILTKALSAAVCKELRLGLSIAQACALAGMKESRFHEWRAKGEQDLEGDILTVYAEFAHDVSAALAQGARACHVAMDRGVTAGSRRVKPAQAAVDIKAGDLAARVLALRQAGVAGAAQRWGPRGEEEQTPAPPQQAAKPADLKRLTDEEAKEFRRLLRKARGEEG